jgi:hypothetical protein
MKRKGSVRLAAMLQQRMGQVKNYCDSPAAELATLKKSGLILDSFPEEIMENDEFILCGWDAASMNEAQGRVLVLWAGDIPVVVGKVKLLGGDQV